MPSFLDTNVLLYSISTAADEAPKRNRAIELLDDDDRVLSVQVLQEFYVQATRASRAGALPHHTAASLIGAWGRFRIQDNTLAVLNAALDVREKTGFSFWDCSIIAAAEIAGCDKLYSEDLSDGRQINGVIVINPFR
jgi:predicted nucleic acid-binding protein